jgi:hypothetical protein
MADNEKVELSFVTEVGVFGDLDINDPTIKNAKKKKDVNIEDMIAEAITENANTLTGLE